MKNTIKPCNQCIHIETCSYYYQLNKIIQESDSEIINELRFECRNYEGYKEHYTHCYNLLKRFYKSACEIDSELCTILNHPNEPELQMGGDRYDELMNDFIDVYEYLKSKGEQQ